VTSAVSVCDRLFEGSVERRPEYWMLGKLDVLEVL
jgi:hypothetical protein